VKLPAPRLVKADDEVAQFNCGEPSLDRWLKDRALTNQASGASRCYVTCWDDRVVGYYALATGIVQRASAPKRIRQSMPDPIPVLLLGRLAVDLKYQSRHLGSYLLRDAIERTVAVAEVVGVAALLVHTMNERARAFYLHHDFVPSVTDPQHVMLSLKDARRLVRREL